MTDERPPAQGNDNTPSAKPASGKPIRRAIASWSRWLHIYLSMFGMATVLFFSVTGLTLNHPDWFFEEGTQSYSGNVNVEWLNNGNSPSANWDESDFGHAVSKLEVAEFLRAEHRLTGSVSDFLAFEDECEVTFQGPGYAATARIDRTTGEYTLDVTANDLVTIMNDLHKGRHTGTAWSWVIDVSAVLSALIAVSGFVLIFFLKLKRRSGIVVSVIGAVVLMVMYWVATN